MIWLSCASQHSGSDESCGVCFSSSPPPCHLIALLWELEEILKGVAETESKAWGRLNFLSWFCIPSLLREISSSFLLFSFFRFEKCHALMCWESCATFGPVNNWKMCEFKAIKVIILPYLFLFFFLNKNSLQNEWYHVVTVSNFMFPLSFVLVVVCL